MLVGQTFLSVLSARRGERPLQSLMTTLGNNRYGMWRNATRFG
jgi:hypothetical protein